MNKTVHLTAKASKTGKLYAAISEQQIVDALKKEFSINIPVSSISIKDHIKIIGKHVVQIAVGVQKSTITVEVKPEVDAAKADA
jgi:ribosomal protein L9